MDPDDVYYLPISALNAYRYCPHRAYLEYALGEWADNRLTLEGKVGHRRAHTPHRERRPGTVRTTQVMLKHDGLRLVGLADVVVEHGGQVVPVEFKRGSAEPGPWDAVQLCAQALCLEEQLQVRIAEGFVWSLTSRHRTPVVFDEALREETRRVAADCLAMVESGAAPPNGYGPRCLPCSLRPICLPRDMAAYRAAVTTGLDHEADEEAEEHGDALSDPAGC